MLKLTAPFCMGKAKIRGYMVQDFKEWYEKGELSLAPKFQRREVWSSKAKSYLIDTIIRGLPMPAVYIRQDVDIETGKSYREVVDGQQRLKTILSYINDGFKVSKIHNEEYGGLYFSQLPSEIQKEILSYEIDTRLLMGVTDKEVYEIFARLNTYTVKLNQQELRNSQFFGAFKQTVYNLSYEYNSFWIENNIFSDKQITRMLEAELVSELLIAMMDGIKGKNNRVINNYYRKYDDALPDREKIIEKFRTCIDTIVEIFGEDLKSSVFSYSHMFYSLFLVVYDLLYGLPNTPITQKVKINKKDFPKIRNALEELNEIIKLSEEDVPDEYKKFYLASKSHTTGLKERVIRHQTIGKKIIETLTD